jgi:glutathione S-transferase
MSGGCEPVASEFAAIWPIQRFPVIVDDGRFVFEATGIIEYLEACLPETARLIPSDLPLAAEVRMWDRLFDNCVSYPRRDPGPRSSFAKVAQREVGDSSALRPAAKPSHGQQRVVVGERHRFPAPKTPALSWIDAVPARRSPVIRLTAGRRAATGG